MVHSQEDLDMAIAASNILFGKSTKENLLQLDEQTFTDVFKDVPHYEVSKDVLGQPAVDVFNQEGMQISQARVRCVSSLRVVALHSTRKNSQLLTSL